MLTSPSVGASLHILIQTIAKNCFHVISLYIKSNLHYAREINCLCGTSYCFKCSTESHSPCPCEMNQKWIELKKDFDFISSNEKEKSNKSIESNTKECPNCHKKNREK